MKECRYLREGAAIGALLLIAALWFGITEWLYPRYFLWDDNTVFYLPLYLFNAEALWSTHQLPLINFFQFAGWNHLGAGQSGVLYAPAYLAAWFASGILQRPLLTIDVLCILHMTAGMLGMYAWMRTLGLPRRYAAAAAIFYLTLPFSTQVSRIWVVVSSVHCFAPFCMMLLDRNLRAPSWTLSVGYALTKALFILGGYPQYVAYLTVMEISYLCLRARSMPGKWRIAMRYVRDNILSIILCLPLLLPMVQAITEPLKPPALPGDSTRF